MQPEPSQVARKYRIMCLDYHFNLDSLGHSCSVCICKVTVMISVTITITVTVSATVMVTVMVTVIVMAIRVMVMVMDGRASPIVWNMALVIAYLYIVIENIPNYPTL